MNEGLLLLVAGLWPQTIPSHNGLYPASANRSKGMPMNSDSNFMKTGRKSGSLPAS
jgi:hypothetical protein